MFSHVCHCRIFSFNCYRTTSSMLYYSLLMLFGSDVFFSDLFFVRVANSKCICAVTNALVRGTWGSLHAAITSASVSFVLDVLILLVSTGNRGGSSELYRMHIYCLESTKPPNVVFWSQNWAGFGPETLLGLTNISWPNAYLMLWP